MPQFEGVEHEVLMPDGGDATREGALDYEELVAAGDEASSSPRSTRTRPRRCVTRAEPPGGRRASSTRTARPCSTRCSPTRPTGSGLRERDTVLPIVPMFHANAWGLPYAAAMAGRKLVLPGPRMDPADRWPS